MALQVLLTAVFHQLNLLLLLLLDADPLKNKTSNLPDPSVSRIINPLEEGPKISLLEPLPVYHFRRWRIEAPELKKTDVQPSAATILSNATGNYTRIKFARFKRINLSNTRISITIQPFWYS